MGVKKTEKGTKKFTKEEKLAILQEAREDKCQGYAGEVCALSSNLLLLEEKVR